MGIRQQGRRASCDQTPAGQSGGEVSGGRILLEWLSGAVAIRAGGNRGGRIRVLSGGRVGVDSARVATRFNDRGRDDTQPRTFPGGAVAKVGDVRRSGGLRESESA